MDILKTLTGMLLAVGLGFLVGLQREYDSVHSGVKRAAGIRTFPLLALLGWMGAFLQEMSHSPFLLPILLFFSGVLLSINHFWYVKNGHLGLTTLFAATLMFPCGILVYLGYYVIAVALTLVITVLLSSKEFLHHLAKVITREELIATLKFVGLTLLLLPLIPDKNFGPVGYKIFNPFKIWLLVMIISGIGFGGYILIKKFGAKKGLLGIGIFGGLASSTALTISLSERSKQNPELSKQIAVALNLAWVMMSIKVILILHILSVPLLLASIKLICSYMAISLVPIFLLKNSKGKKLKSNGSIRLKNPFELKPALEFTVMLLVVMAGTKWFQIHAGDRGLLLSSFIGGLADVDAIILTLTEILKENGSLSMEVAKKAVILCMVANNLFKGIWVFLFGDFSLKRTILIPVLFMTCGGGLLIYLS